MDNAAKAEPYGLVTPVSGELTEDELAIYEQDLPDLWRDSVTDAGGTPAGEPTIERHENPAYGSVLVDENGWPIRDDNGEPIRDQTRWHIYLKGPAIRG
jgi:hypothetical protein